MFPRAIALAAIGALLLRSPSVAAQHADAAAGRATVSSAAASPGEAFSRSPVGVPEPFGLSAPAADTPAADTLDQPKRSHSEVRLLGGFSVGFPEGVSAELHVEPIRRLRVGVGVGYNSVSFGPSLQLSWFPFTPWLLVRASGGYFFEGDASHLLASSNAADRALLKRVSYGFGSLRAGWEGHLGWAGLSVLAGVSYLRSPVRNVSSLLDANTSANDSTEIRVPEDPILSALFPSVQLGIVFGAPRPE